MVAGKHFVGRIHVVSVHDFVGRRAGKRRVPKGDGEVQRFDAGDRHGEGTDLVVRRDLDRGAAAAGLPWDRIEQEMLAGQIEGGRAFDLLDRNVEAREVCRLNGFGFTMLVETSGDFPNLLPFRNTGRV